MVVTVHIFVMVRLLFRCQYEERQQQKSHIAHRGHIHIGTLSWYFNFWHIKLFRMLLLDAIATIFHKLLVEGCKCLG